MTEHSPLSARRELSARATPLSSDRQVSLVSANNSVSVAPLCSVIIPSYCSAQTISACLMALRCQDIQLSYEIIVVDSSPDETADIVRRDFPQVKLIHLPQKTGPELARNTGALHARGKIFAFIDSDCIAEPDWLCRLVARLEAGCDAVGGAISNGNGGTLVSWAGYFCEFREFLPGGPTREVPYLSLGTVAYRRETFLEAGGFPPSYYPMEDQVFHWSLRKRGMRIVLDPQIVVAHMHRSERSQFLEHQRRIGRANAQVMHVLKLRGNMLARYPLLALVAMPLLILYRFTRTLIICLKVEDALVLRNPSLTWLCWLGMCWWARGFLDGAFAGLPPAFLANSEYRRRDEPTTLLSKEHELGAEG